VSLRVSLRSSNHVETAAVISATSAATGYPVANVATPANPFTPYKSAAAGAGQIITVDHGSAKPVEVVALIRTNFLTATFQADDAATFNSAAGAPQYTAALTCAEALNGRYHGWHRPAATVTRRYNRIVIANQTPVATVPHAAGAPFYLVGGLWLGPLATVPRDILMDPDLERQEPVDDVALPSGGRSRSLMGYPFLTLTARRLAEDQTDSKLDAQLRAWLALDRAWGEADVALVLPRDLVAADAYVMRRLKGAAWTWGRIWSEGDLTLEEVAQ
jgi:hypothetical protein